MPPCVEDHELRRQARRQPHFSSPGRSAKRRGGPFNAFDIPDLPVAVTVFPGEIYRAPRNWGERAFGNLVQ
ncbi:MULTISPECIES: hypothetical protein [Streptomyces]|uniref:Uncharacterized protein n=2 Tax=Streptomyces TaxID=1883 RepID=A0ABV9IP83_9ACTN